MEFAVLTRVASLIFTPGNFLVWLLIIGSGLLFTAWYRAGRVVLLATAILCLFLAVLPAGSWLASPLEDKFPRPSLPAHLTGILVLSGGSNPAMFASRDVPGTDSGGRMLAASELLRRYPDAKLIFSGGIAPLTGQLQPDTVVARTIFSELGIPPSRIIWESHSRSTWENFTYSHTLANPKPGDAWVVVTSALNMPRAMGIAAKLCWPIIPWPSDYISSGNEERIINMDFTGDVGQLEADTHEWLGLLAYKLTGRLRSKPCTH